MNVESELLWPGVALLLLLGTVAGLCVRCSRPGKGRSGTRAGSPALVAVQGRSEKLHKAERKPLNHP